MDIDFELERLEANPGDVLILRVPEAVKPPDTKPILSIGFDLRNRGYCVVVLVEGETLEALDDVLLAAVGLRRIAQPHEP